jgi:hypothetical protein
MTRTPDYMLMHDVAVYLEENVYSHGNHKECHEDLCIVLRMRRHLRDPMSDGSRDPDYIALAESGTINRERDAIDPVYHAVVHRLNRRDDLRDMPVDYFRPMVGADGVVRREPTVREWDAHLSEMSRRAATEGRVCPHRTFHSDGCPEDAT